MQHIKTIVGQAAKWSQPEARQRHYELTGTIGKVASLQFQSMFGSLARAESADGCWTFKRVGFWKPKLTVRACGSEQDLGVFQNQTWSGGGTLELQNGASYRFSTGMWQNLTITNASDEPLVRFNTSGLLHLSADVEVEPRAADSPDLSLLVLLGFYVVVMFQTDSTMNQQVAYTS